VKTITHWRTDSPTGQSGSEYIPLSSCQGIYFSRFHLTAQRFCETTVIHFLHNFMHGKDCATFTLLREKFGGRVHAGAKVQVVPTAVKAPFWETWCHSTFFHGVPPTTTSP
jgi:hypothetical protein